MWTSIIRASADLCVIWLHQWRSYNHEKASWRALIRALYYINRLEAFIPKLEKSLFSPGRRERSDSIDMIHSQGICQRNGEDASTTLRCKMTAAERDQQKKRQSVL